MKLTARQIQTFAPFDEATLFRWFEAIGTHPDHRIKRGMFKGCVKQKWVRYSDEILAEVGRRRRARGEDSCL